MTTILMLLGSNVLMTFAWYWHLKYPEQILWKVILISWAIAFFEYCLAVPANRIGFSSGFSAAQLKITQEVITLAVFAVFAIFYLGEPLKWNYFAAFACLVAAVIFIFKF
ncbi:DMT family protein [Ferrovibrio sp.]|uniref:DMT family protein n=1 Tax=Ferrovibrio sp. TaxID=1917215 RepID=UPI0025C208E3|nr:DMT family protein [Ferrovibrio sp.]MBX3454236.1 DMT family protein [Ferrovibrio sp.]